jgi:two-component system phosphate regulon sensor histidine kinase PhoR
MEDVTLYLAAVPTPVLLVDAGERIRFANDSAGRLLGEGLIGRHYISILRQPTLLDCIEGALQRGVVTSGIYLSTSAGRETTHNVLATPVDAGQGREVLVSLEDVTPLQEAGQMRRDFVANVSHELRTPLTALLGFIETLRGAARADAATRDRFLSIMEKEAQRMNRLVHDLLSLSRVESNERTRPTEMVDVTRIIRSTAESLRTAQAENVCEIVIEAESPSKHVPADPDQLTQVFANLFENAIKYGGKGGMVTVRISYPEHEPMLRGPAVRIEVIDQGPGIDPIHIPRLTERFYRIDGHRSRELGGTGLGLAIVKHIVSRHRGRLRITSEPGKGSCFTVILPVQ